MKADNQITTERANWSFSGEVAKHFDDHVDKSVPGYHEGHELVVKLSDFFVFPTAFAMRLVSLQAF